MSATDKPIVLSRHADQRTAQRGATLEEVERVIRAGTWRPAQRGKLCARHVFSYCALSPVNGRHYDYETVEAVFIADPSSIVVVTVKVYYHD